MMDRRKKTGFGLIEILVVLVLVVMVFFLIRGVYGKKGIGVEGSRYDKIFNDAKQQIEKIDKREDDKKR
jgi:competence protein ComGC